jgi:hypothetical protein
VTMDRHKNPFTCYFCHKKIQNETEMVSIKLQNTPRLRGTRPSAAAS